MSPHPTIRVLTEIADERDRQDEKWGEQNHPDLGGSVFAALPSARLARRMCQAAAKAGEVTWAHILLEEFAESIDAAHDRCTVELREELIQVAAVAVAWIEAIDRRSVEGTADSTQEPGHAD